MARRKSCLAYACIRLDMAGFSHVSCKSSILSVEEPAHQLREASAEHSGQAGTGREVTNTLRSSVFFSLSLSFDYVFFVFFSLYLVMPSPVPVLLPFCLVPCLCFFPLKVDGFLCFFSLLLCLLYPMLYCSFAAFFLLFFPACIFVFPALFSCSFYPILAMFVRFRCSASSLCFRISLFSYFPVLLLYCDNNSKSNKNSNKNNKRREQQTYQEPPEQPDKNENEVVSRGCFYFERFYLRHVHAMQNARFYLQNEG